MAQRPRGPQPQTNARMAAAEKARSRAQQEESRRQRKTSSYIKYEGEQFQAEDGVKTTLTVIPYTVKEQHHPTGISQGEIYYKRPFLVHRNIGPPDAGQWVVCPRTFNERAKCSVCSDVQARRKAVLDIRKSLSEEEFKRRIKEAGINGTQERELMQVYHHEVDKVFLMNEAVGGGNLRGFPIMLTEKVLNPPSYVGEEASAFYLDGPLAKAANIPGEGYALEIMWRGSGRAGGGRDWINAVSIDFKPRAKAPVPDWAWKKSIDLSECLVRVSDDELWNLYNELDPDDKDRPEVESSYGTERDKVEEKPQQEEEAQGEDDIPFEEWDKDKLLNYAKGEKLFDDRTLRALGRKSEDEIREAISKAEEDLEDDSQPDEGAEGSCPAKLEFGKSFNSSDACNDCPDDTYQACGDVFDTMKK